MPDFQPLPGRALILTDVAPTESAGGLTLVQNWNPETTGQVAYLGKTAKCKHCSKGMDPPVAVGDRVLFNHTAGTEIVWGGETYLSLRFEDILCVFEDEGAA